MVAQLSRVVKMESNSIITIERKDFMRLCALVWQILRNQILIPARPRTLDVFECE
jgi:hypothetical protein